MPCLNICNNNSGITNYSKFDKAILFAFIVYIVLTPFYFWESGLPQVSDLFIVLLIPLYTLKRKLIFIIHSKTKRYIILGIILVFYISIVNLVWMVLLNESLTFIRTSLFYIYNLLIALLTVALFSEYKYKLVRTVYRASLMSVIIQTILFFISGGFGGGRSTVGFNNPNQLGYYTILITGILIYSSSHIKISSKWFICGISCSTVLVLASLSNAAIISYFALLVGFIIFEVSNKKLKRKLTIVSISLLIVFIFVFLNTTIIQDNLLFQSLIRRLSRTPTKIGEISDVRGYYRIIEYPQYWIFGAGEGAYYRFRNSIYEFHSTLGNIQVSYGIVGMILFLRFIHIALMNDKYRSWYIIGVIMIYGITHNGIRSGILWMLISLIACSFITNKGKEESCG